MTPMEGTDTILEKDFGAISGGPLFSQPLCFIADKIAILSRLSLGRVEVRPLDDCPATAVRKC